jgi:hypothetical protein
MQIPVINVDTATTKIAIKSPKICDISLGVVHEAKNDLRAEVENWTKNLFISKNVRNSGVTRCLLTEV